MMSRIRKAIIPEYSNEQIANSSYRFSLKFLVQLIWLFAAAFVVYYFEIEKNKGFEKVAVIITGAFLLYIIIPLQFRKLFLVFLAFVVETYLFGPKVASGVTVFIIYFVALTYVKGKMLRNVLVIISMLLCVAITSKFIVLPFARIVIMFGALFLMLRYIYFLYELNYFKTPPIFIDRLCYLFLIPNACFPLFPALSPVEYLKSYYSEPSENALAKGLHWITVGIFQLLLYRVIYLYFSPSPYEVESFGVWVWFILSAYSLIFRLSGLFYLAMGFLQIFGFKLPPIFNHVYFAAGFADLWRRVNLYWRAFMIRVFYYPLVFKFKKFSSAPIVFAATLSMFICTWLLHSWQWYWIKGTYYFYPNDFLFWFILGLLVSSYAVVSLNRLKNAELQKKKQNHFLAAAQVLLMFFGMSFLWSLWTSTSVTEFIYILKFSWKGTVQQYVSFAGFAGLTVVIAGLIRWLYYERNWFEFIFKDVKPFIGITFCLALVGVSEMIKKKDLSEEMGNFISMNINNRDRTLIERGYYEQILNTDSRSIDLMNANNKFANWNLDRDAYVRTENELMKEFKPDHVTTFKGDTLRTNSFGIRDKEYSVERPNGFTRIAFVGGSYVMGSGVSNEENFAALLEEKLKTDSVEILNFGVGGYFLIQNVLVTENKIGNYHPDYLFFFIHSSYRARCLDNFANLIQKRTNINTTFLNSIIEKAGIKKGMCHLEIYNRLKPFIDEIFKWGFETMRTACKEQNIQPVMVYLPTHASLKTDEDKEFCFSLAKRTGFHMIDLSEVYVGQKANDIQISSWDTHPNAKGHELISNLLLEKMKKDEQFFKFMP